MKLQDKETQSIAKSVSDVLEKKEVKEIKFPHKMYGPKGEECTAKDQEEHEEYTAKGYSHTKPVKEVDEPTAKGEKDFKAKHKIKKSGMKDDGTVVKEMLGVDEKAEEVTISVDTSILEDSQTYPGMNDETAEEVLDDAIKAGLKPKWQVNKDKSGVDVQVTGPEKKFDKFIKLMNKRPSESGHHGRDPYEPKVLKKYNKYKGKFNAESVNEGWRKYRDPKLPPIPRTDHQLQIAIDIVKNRHKGMKSTRGHQSPEEAEKKLRTKYKYTDKMIAKLKEGSTFANKLRGPAKEVFQKALAQIKKEKIKRSDEKKRNDIIDGIDGARHINDRDMRDIKRAMTYESHDDFKDESVEEDKSKFSKALLKKATDTALKMSGNMTGAVKEIEKMKKGLSKDKKVAAALQLANEEVSEAILVAAHEIDEATKAGKGKVKLDIDWIGDKKLAADVKKKYNVTVKPTGRTTADISGNKQDIVKMMLAPDVMGFDQDDLEDLFPELFEAVAIPADEAEQSPKQKKYQAFFKKALKKFGVKSPQELKRDKRKEFFDYVDANWEENARRVGSATAH